jgi:hypothetical protein
MPEQVEVEFADEAQVDTANTGANNVNPRLAGLRPWKPGQSGNPNGRPRRKPLTEELERLLDEIDPTDKKHRRTFRKRIVEALAFQVIKKGNVAAFTEIADRVEGKVAQRQEHTGADGGPVVFESIGSRQEVEQKITILLTQAQERRAEPVTTSHPQTIEGEVTISQPAPVQTSQPLALWQIQMEPVEGSSNVAATGYDPMGRTLLVRYLNGGVYVWRQIPHAEYQALRSAESAGQYMREIEGRYGIGAKVEPQELQTPATPAPVKPALDLSW